MAMKMVPQVLDCKVKSCSYNKDATCHTMAITIGQGSDPMCDTFTNMPICGGVKEAKTFVGACKMSDCAHNENLECGARGVHVAMKHNQPDCMTFSKR
jgi:hypothetical protein